MSEQDALRFLQALREDANARDAFGRQADKATPDDLVALGSSFGWHFDAREFSQAFRRDWLLRWLHFRARRGTRP